MLVAPRRRGCRAPSRSASTCRCRASRRRAPSNPERSPLLSTRSSSPIWVFQARDPGRLDLGEGDGLYCAGRTSPAFGPPFVRRRRRSEPPSNSVFHFLAALALADRWAEEWPHAAQTNDVVARAIKKGGRARWGGVGALVTARTKAWKSGRVRPPRRAPGALSGRIPATIPSASAITASASASRSRAAASSPGSPRASSIFCPRRARCAPGTAGEPPARDRARLDELLLLASSELRSTLWSMPNSCDAQPLQLRRAPDEHVAAAVRGQQVGELVRPPKNAKLSVDLGGERRARSASWRRAGARRSPARPPPRTPRAPRPAAELDQQGAPGCTARRGSPGTSR